MEKFISTKELASYFGVEIFKIYKMKEEGMPCHNMSFGDRPTYRFKISEVEKWLAEKNSSK